MYWPLGTPRIFSLKTTNPIATYDSDDKNGTEPLVALSPSDDPEATHSRSDKQSLLADDLLLKDDHAVGDEEKEDLEEPGVRGGRGAESGGQTLKKELLGPHRTFDGLLDNGKKSGSSLDVTFSEELNDQAANNAILALKMSRNGALFATITITELTIWQTKVC